MKAGTSRGLERASTYGCTEGIEEGLSPIVPRVTSICAALWIILLNTGAASVPP